MGEDEDSTTKTTPSAGQVDGQNNGQSEPSSEDAGSDPERGSSSEEGQSACNSSGADTATPSDVANAEAPGRGEDLDEDVEEVEEQGEDGDSTATTGAFSGKRLAGRGRNGQGRKRRRPLFTIQAVNSNGTTERGMGEGGSAFSFSCE